MAATSQNGKEESYQPNLGDCAKEVHLRPFPWEAQSGIKIHRKGPGLLPWRGQKIGQTRSSKNGAITGGEQKDPNNAAPKALPLESPK